MKCAKSLDTTTTQLFSHIETGGRDVNAQNEKRAEGTFTSNIFYSTFISHYF